VTIGKTSVDSVHTTSQSELLEYVWD